MDAQLYYTPPSDEIFDELKSRAIEIWKTMGDEPSYSEEKIGRIEHIRNIKDNFMYMVAMFDIHNQRRLAALLTPDARFAVRERMVDGGNPDWYIVF